LLEKDYELAYEQISYAGEPATIGSVTTSGTINESKTGHSITLSGKNFSLVFDTEKGILSSYRSGNLELIKSGPQPGFYRAATDNDIGAGLNQSLRPWKDAYEKSGMANVTTEKIDVGRYKVSITKSILDGKATTNEIFTVYGDGTLHVSNNFTIEASAPKTIMRVGNDLQVNSQLNNIQWYGRGPWENYWDRKYASEVGLYQQKLDQQYFSYARPQESGNKTDVRWLTLTNGKGKGIRVSFADSLLSFSALPYSIDDLDPAPEKHQYHSGELVARDQIYLHIDLKQLGVQGIDSWGSMPLKKYWITPGKYSYSYWIKPL
jgi:beta-galactosidase